MKLHAILSIAASLTAVASAAPAQAASPAPAVMEMDPTLPDHTVYRPANLHGFGRKLPVIAWGNGGCANVGNSAEAYLRDVAAEGFVIAAGGPIVVMPRPAAPGAQRPPQGTTAQLIATIDWAIAENGRKGSRYFNRLDTSKVAVMGRSCGGLQAIAAGADPRVTTVVVINSGIIRGGVPEPDGTVTQRAYIPAGEPDLKKLHTPVAYFVGGPRDQAYRGAEADFAMIDGLQLFYANIDAGHGGTFAEPKGGAMGVAVVDWLKWRLLGDQPAAASFQGASCRLCADSRWTVKKKNMP